MAAKKTSKKKTAGASRKDKRSSTGSDDQGKTARGKTRSGSEEASGGLRAEAMRVVEQAASILEEEIAAGIVAAKKVEERYVNINALRTGAPEHVIQRFRKDAHEVLDILLDLVNLSISAFGGLSERAINIRTERKTKDGSKAEESLQELVIPTALKPGETGTVSMLVENDSDKGTGPFEFTTAGLLSASGERLQAKHIRFDPPMLEVAANDVKKVNITVSIPAGAAPGHYSGLVLAPAIQMRAILTAQVEA